MKLNFIKKFLFDKIPIRGAYLELDSTWAIVKNQKDYPDGIKQVLGELIAVNILLSTNLKIKGKIATQIQNSETIDFIVSECKIDSSNIFIRATAKYSNAITQDMQMSYQQCVAKGHLVVSIDLDNDKRIYQSIIAMTSKSITDDIEEYMLQSEQLRTKIVLKYSEDKIVAFMLQQLPDEANKYEDEINRIFLLAETLTPEELEKKDLATIFKTLYNEDDILLFDEQNINFACNCSRDVVSNMLRTLGKNEVVSILDEMGVIDVSCDYCNTKYSYYGDDIDNIFTTLSIDVENVSNEVH